MTDEFQSDKSSRTVRMGVGALTLLILISAPVAAQSADSPAPTRQMTRISDDGASSSQMQESIHRGLEWLARRQEKDGSFGSDSQYGRHVGITALACL
ncbi:MAG: hypothetical protein B6D36_14825, partial [Planctomycetes bacterium UTPLA1]